MRVLWIYALCNFALHAQDISYNPGQLLEKTASTAYYDTEYIFIRNNSDEPVNLFFQLTSENFPPEWSVTGCTNLICYTKIPDDGSFGTIGPNQEAYMSVNLSANQIPGEGRVSFMIYSDQNLIFSDSLVFQYYMEEGSEKTEPQPWAKIGFAQNVITVFLNNPNEENELLIYNVQGDLMAHQSVEDIASFSLANFTAGIYLVVVRDKSGKEIIQKVLKV